MQKVVLYASMSIDGYAAGVGDDMRVLHGWAFGDPRQAIDPVVSAEFFEAGAVIFGAGTLRAGDREWGEKDIFPMPVFVPMHKPRAPVHRNGSAFTFVGSVEEALARARAAAGDKDVYIMGSPNVAQQLLAAGQIDELELALTEVILGDGIPLLDRSAVAPARLERVRVVESRGIMHLRYLVQRPLDSVEA
jgi:dihydrofolate reductase